MKRFFGVFLGAVILTAGLWAAVQPRIDTVPGEWHPGMRQRADPQLKGVAFPGCKFNEVWVAFLQAVPDFGWTIATKDKEDGLLGFHEQPNFGTTFLNNLNRPQYTIGVESKDLDPESIEQPGFRCVFVEKDGEVYVTVKRLGRGAQHTEGAPESTINYKTLNKFTEFINKVATYIEN